MFYAFEGINGSGKTTALAALAKRLRARHGESAVVTLFNPSKSPVGTELRRFFAEQRDAGLPPMFGQGADTMLFAKRCAMLFMADRHMMQPEIREHLRAGTIVLCDRYSLSTLVYQCAMVGDVAMQSSFAHWICMGHVGVAEPTRTFILDLPVDVSRRRLAERGERLDDRVMADIEPAVRAMYVDYDLASKQTGMPEITGAMHPYLVDANRDVEAIVDELEVVIEAPAF